MSKYYLLVRQVAIEKKWTTEKLMKFLRDNESKHISIRLKNLERERNGYGC